MADDGSVARYRTNLQGEVDSAALYRAMAGAEKDPHLSEIYRRLAQRFGPQFVLPTLSTLERRDSGMYDQQPEAVAGGLPAAERSHNRVVEAMESAMPGGVSGSALARLEGRHRTGGNALRAAVL